MRRIIIIFFAILLSLSAKSQVTQSEAGGIVDEYINKNISDYYWLYMEAPSMVRTNGEITTLSGTTLAIPQKNSWVYFVDELPYSNWSHKCRFLFVDKSTGELSSIAAVNPPKDLKEWVMLTEYPNVPEGSLFNFENIGNLRVNGQASNCYAVIISGGADSYNNWVRYWNDCSAIYSTLIRVYGYSRDHISVIMSDGTNPGADRHHNNGTYDSSPLDLDGDGTNDIQYAATKANIALVFNALSQKMTSNDFLFIFTTDHGGQTSGDNVYLNLWGETMSDAEFAKEVKKVNAGQISIVMEQCHSGGFISDLSSEGRVLATACTANENSYAMPPNYTYNEFVYHWIGAVAGIKPDGGVVKADVNGDGVVSMQEAFQYARTADTQTETPQYNSIGASLGNSLSLWGGISTTVYVRNRIIQANEIINGTNIEVENVTISNNANVVFDAAGITKFKGGFKCEKGSSMKVK